MKTLGLLGGMSWESTIPYYRIINETVRERLGGLHSARMILYSVDFADIERRQQAGAWDEAGTLLADAARALEAAGAEGLALCTNTMHKVAAAIENAVAIPLLHIADATAAAINRRSAHGRVARHPIHDGTGFLPGPVDGAARSDGAHSRPRRAGDRSPRHL